MKHLKTYNKLNEEVLDFDAGFELKNPFDKEIISTSKPESQQYKRVKEIAQNGNLYKYLVTGERNFTFGMLRALHEDALMFKKRRELIQDYKN